MRSNSGTTALVMRAVENNALDFDYTATTSSRRVHHFSAGGATIAGLGTLALTLASSTGASLPGTIHSVDSGLSEDLSTSRTIDSTSGRPSNWYTSPLSGPVVQLAENVLSQSIRLEAQIRSLASGEPFSDASLEESVSGEIQSIISDAQELRHYFSPGMALRSSLSPQVMRVFRVEGSVGLSSVEDAALWASSRRALSDSTFRLTYRQIDELGRQKERSHFATLSKLATKMRRIGLAGEDWAEGGAATANAASFARAFEFLSGVATLNPGSLEVPVDTVPMPNGGLIVIWATQDRRIQLFIGPGGGTSLVVRRGSHDGFSFEKLEDVDINELSDLLVATD